MFTTVIDNAKISLKTKDGSFLPDNFWIILLRADSRLKLTLHVIRSLFQCYRLIARNIDSNRESQ